MTDDDIQAFNDDTLAAQIRRLHHIDRSALIGDRLDKARQARYTIHVLTCEQDRRTRRDEHEA